MAGRIVELEPDARGKEVLARSPLYLPRISPPSPPYLPCSSSQMRAARRCSLSSFPTPNPNPNRNRNRNPTSPNPYPDPNTLTNPMPYAHPKPKPNPQPKPNESLTNAQLTKRLRAVLEPHLTRWWSPPAWPRWRTRPRYPAKAASSDTESPGAGRGQLRTRTAGRDVSGT